MAQWNFETKVPSALEALMLFDKGMEQGTQWGTQRKQAAARKEAEKALTSGDPMASRGALARLIGAGDTAGANALANFGNQTFDQNYKTQQLDLQRQIAGRRETPQQLQILKAAGIDPASPEGRKSLFPRTDTPISATDKKAIFAAEDEVPVIESTISTLKRAKELNDSTFTGYTAGPRGEIGSKAPSWLSSALGIDPKAAEATNEWSSLMSMEAIKTMADTLKGATTDFELNTFVAKLADPSTPPKVRKSIIDRMMTLSERKREIAQSRVKDLRSGDYFKSGGGAQAPTATPRPAAGGDPMAAARDAIARGAPRDAVMKRLLENGIDPAGL